MTVAPTGSGKASGRISGKTSGITLTETVAVLAILAVLAAILIPTMSGFIEKTRKEQCILEARGVQNAAQAYFIYNYGAGRQLDLPADMVRFTRVGLNGPENPLYGYLAVDCADDAVLESLAVKADTLEVTGIDYRCRGYRVEIKNGTATAEQNRKSSGKNSRIPGGNPGGQTDGRRE